MAAAAPPPPPPNPTGSGSQKPTPALVFDTDTNVGRRQGVEHEDAPWRMMDTTAHWGRVPYLRPGTQRSSLEGICSALQRFERMANGRGLETHTVTAQKGNGNGVQIHCSLLQVLVHDYTSLMDLESFWLRATCASMSFQI